MRRNGFTLLELLFVIAIIALLAALLLPVFQQARKKSYEPVCIHNLRQFHVAFSLYREDYGETARYQALLLPYIRDKRILRCPMDHYPRGAAWLGSDPKGWVETSYHYYRPFTDLYRRIMERAEPNHGIAVCLLHGRRRPMPPASKADVDYVGKVLRLRLDGSVSSAYAEILCFRESPERHYPSEMRHPWYLYTDIPPIPQEVLDTDPSLRGKEYWPCE